MLKILGLTSHHSVGASNWTFFLSLTITAFCCFWYSVKLLGNGAGAWFVIRSLATCHYWRHVYSADRVDDPIRYPAAVALVLIGVDIRIAGWVPWKGMTLADDRGTALGISLKDFWVSISWTWTDLGLMFVIAGLTALFFVWLDAKFGPWKYAAVAVMTSVCIAWGVAGTEFVALYIDRLAPLLLP